MSADKKKVEVVFPEVGDIVHGYERKKTYKVTRTLGKGAFGAVVEVELISSDEQTSETSPPPCRLAMKCEMSKGRARFLKLELAILREFRKGGRHVCHVYDRSHTASYRFIIMTLVGKDLHTLRKACKPEEHFTKGTALRVAIQTLEALEDLHEVGYLHRDIKPGNFAIGSNTSKLEQRKVYILDFGLARKYKKEDGQLRRPRTDAGFRGTHVYASMHSHKSVDLGRRDDLESWLYMIIELTSGTLKWNRIELDMREPTAREQRRNIMLDSKQYYVQEPSGRQKLFAGCPRCYGRILKYLKHLEFWSKPDYGHIYDLLRLAMKLENVKASDPYDWETGGKYWKLIEIEPPPPPAQSDSDAGVGSSESDSTARTEETDMSGCSCASSK